MNILSIYAWIFSFFCQDPSPREPLDLIKVLIDELHADVNHADDEGRTPLHLAVMRGRFHSARYLIDRGAKVDVSMNSIS
jgi:ankyrin repeat protein